MDRATALKDAGDGFMLGLELESEPCDNKL
jgi:hypothetical protein